jgi:LTXXQ motif family protein
MICRLSSLVARAVTAAMVLGGAAANGLSPQATLAQGTGGRSSSGTAQPDQDTGNTPPGPNEPAPERRGKQPLADPIAARIDYLHERLRITPAQEPLWAQVAQVMRENAKAVAPLIRERGQSAQHGNAIDYLNSYERLGEAQLDDLKKFIAAFQPLYDSLSADQKKIADSIFRLGPLGIVGGIPEAPEALLAPAPYEYAPTYPPSPSYAGLPPPYFPYPYYPVYPYRLSRPAYPVYPYYGYPSYGPWFGGPPIGAGVSAFFFRGPHHFHGFHGAHAHAPHGVGHRR